MMYTEMAKILVNAMRQDDPEIKNLVWGQMSEESKKTALQMARRIFELTTTTGFTISQLIEIAETSKESLELILTQAICRSCSAIHCMNHTNPKIRGPGNECRYLDVIDSILIPITIQQNEDRCKMMKLMAKMYELLNHAEFSDGESFLGADEGRIRGAVLMREITEEYNTLTGNKT